MGGCLLNDGLWWGATFFQLVAQPPDPVLVGPAWRAMWRERLAAAEPFPLRWMRHPLRDAYWKQGSVCEDYGALACPVLAVGGWADGYTNAIPRLVANLASPRRGLVGPWGHVYPHDGAPGPTIGFLQEAARWWRAWLVDGRAPDAEPAYRVWMQESVPPGFAGDRPGRWVAERRWPSPRIEARTLCLAPGALVERPTAARLTVASPQTTGRAAGGWLVASVRDQRQDDAGSLVFDGAPLGERTEILGAPELRLTVLVDRPVAFVVARLCDVAPDGRATRVTYGMLNLTHRDAHAAWQPLAPGEPYEVTVRMNDVAHAFPAGHRVRLALSTAYWPLVWPSPEPVVLTVLTENGGVVLPVRPPDPADAALRAFEPPEQAPASEWEPLTHAQGPHESFVDPASGDHVTRRRSGRDESGAVALARLAAADLEGGDATEVETRIHPDDPLRARASMRQRTELRRAGWSAWRTRCSAPARSRRAWPGRWRRRGPGAGSYPSQSTSRSRARSRRKACSPPHRRA
jgi:predicted acyl esterase